MSNCLLDQHCINCELFMSESEIHKNIGINAGNYGSNGFNVTVLDAIFCIYGFSARDLAFAHLNLNFETDENILQQKELSEVTSYILQRGLPLCSNCVLSIKQVFINHVKLKKEASKFSLLSKLLKRNRSFEIKKEVDCEEERGSNHENIESWKNPCDTTNKQTGLELPDQGSFQEFEPFHEFEDFDFRSDAEDIKVDPLSCVQNEEKFSPNTDNLLSKMKPFSIVLNPVNSGTAPISRRRGSPRKQYKTIFSTKKKGEERLLNRQRRKALKKAHSPSENKESNGKTKVYEESDHGNLSRIKSEATQNLFEGEDKKSVTQCTEDEVYHCQPCDRYFKELFHFKRHQKSKYCANKTNKKPKNSVLKRKSSAEKEKYFKCSCGYSGCKIENLVQHEKNCKSSIPVMCDTCGQFFKRSHSLYAHRKIEHSQSSPSYPTCDVCGAVFVWRVTLKHHMASVHSTDGTTFVCDKCGDSFTTMKNMRRHQIRTHVDETLDKELFRCKICGILLKHHFGLKKHMRIMHSENQKLIACEQCGKTTKSMTNMRIHMKVHDPNRVLKSNKHKPASIEENCAVNITIPENIQ